MVGIRQTEPVIGCAQRDVALQAAALAAIAWQAARPHDDVADLAGYARTEGLVVVGVDNTPGSVRLELTEIPRRCVLLFGQEGPGLTEEARAAAALTVSIAQFGSTRSVNAGVAAGIVMHTWLRQHADLERAW